MSLVVCNRGTAPPEPGCHKEPADRVVIADDGREVRLVLYRGAAPVARVALSPIGALALATQLLQASMPRLA